MEVWKDVPGYEGLYQVSTGGRVRSLERTEEILMTYGVFRRTRKQRLLKLQVVNGYLSVGLHRDGDSKTCRVNRLVLLAFVGTPSVGMQACHIDGDPLNNKVENLRWDTASGNMRDKYKHGTMYRGATHHKTGLTESDIIEIRLSSKTQNELAKEYGITQAAVSSIRLGRTWKHVVVPSVLEVQAA